MKTLHNTWLNYRETSRRGEINEGKSLTQPDMALTLSELLRRHSQGREVPMFPVEYDDPDNPTPDLRGIDMADLMDMRIANAETIESIRQDLQKPKKPKKTEEKPKDTEQPDSQGDAG